LARLDTVAAAQIVRDDKAIDEEFRAFVRKLISYMTGRSAFDFGGLDFLFIAKAIERIGDHAKNHRGADHLYRQGYRRASQVPRDALEREALS
jgi:phosphate transport system protein